MKRRNELFLIAGAVGTAAAIAAYLLWSKRDIPKGATAVEPFDLERYLGTWHEIARLPNKVENNLKALTEKYSIREDGMVSVISRAFDTEKQRWVKAFGKAKLAERQNMGKLKVSFFGPFYFSYNVLDIDEYYHYALVSGNDRDSLWILSRETTIPHAIRERFLNHAKGIGFDTERLEWPAVA
jgi:apolipoprotein D and lipocalin family protein